MANIFKMIVCCLPFLGSTVLYASSLLCVLDEINESSFEKYEKILEGSTWIVPPQTLLAIQYTDGTNTPVQDQTVWIISEFKNGYFMGKAYVALNGNPTSNLNLVGSITPFGDVYIAFYPTTGRPSNTDVVVGIGKLEKIDHQYTFIMQMNSAQNRQNGLAHWSYMISVKPNDVLYQHLPSLNLSVPEFISLF